PASAAGVVAAAPAPVLQAAPAAFAAPVQPVADGDALRGLIAQQMQLMQQQLALLAGAVQAAPAPAAAPVPQPAATPVAAAAPVAPTQAPLAEAAAPGADEEAGTTRYDVQKEFGAIARTYPTVGHDLHTHQRPRLDATLPPSTSTL